MTKAQFILSIFCLHSILSVIGAVLFAKSIQRDKASGEKIDALNDLEGRLETLRLMINANDNVWQVVVFLFFFSFYFFKRRIIIKSEHDRQISV